jgi:hypothetical protein
VSLPLWLGATIAVLLVVVGALAFSRGAIIRVALVLLLALTGCWMLDHFWRDLAAERQTIEARAFELRTRALAPGSALACLDPITGTEMEEPCEKALFASPQATAAAVSYVAAQLALLSSARDHAQRTWLMSDADVLTDLRRPLEADRFGIVAHVFAVRDHCSTPDCAALNLLPDSSRVSANIEQRRFETNLKRHMSAWSGAADAAVSSHPVASAPAVAPSVAGISKPPNGLFFPSASSIPPVNIMTAEPAAPRQPPTGHAGSTEPAAPSRRPPSGAPARQPASPGPTSLTPPGVQ